MLLFGAAFAGDSKEGRNKEKAVVLVPLPFEQESDPYAVASKDVEMWFLFYADKDENFVFEFTEKTGAGNLKASFFTDSDTPELETTKKLGDGKSMLISFAAKVQGNHYIKLTVDDKGSWSGTVKYYIGTPASAP